ncbi:Rhodanese-like domain-containing protein [Poronia punctata]|nr:Rhodanese-like domain-containing protein [Poronia punctata]
MSSTSTPARRLLLKAARPCPVPTSLRAVTGSRFASYATAIPIPAKQAQAQAQTPRFKSPSHISGIGNVNKVRWSTTSATGSKIWTFEEIQSLTKNPEKATTKKTKIIDVREPSELKTTGRIPGALNIPVTTSPEAFHLSREDFEDRFGFEMPDKDDEVVFYCKAGVRSRAAAGIAREAGWRNVGEYPGSWIEWSGKGGDVER